MKTILITGAIGDVFALESFWEKEEIGTILYATSRHRQLKELFNALPTYKRFEQKVIYDDWNQRHDLSRKSELEKELGYSVQAEDYSIAVKFEEYASTPMKSSSWLEHQVAWINRLKLPERFTFIHPYTWFDRRKPDRNFNATDWEWVLKALEASNTPGVVVNLGNDPVPIHPLVIDLSNQTNLLEGIEILKAANGYLGIDSAFSILAAKLFDCDNLFVKTVNQHVMRNRSVYYAPHETFPWLANSAEALGYLRKI